MSAPWLLATLALFALAAHPLWLLRLPLPVWLLGACGLGFSWHLWWSGRGPAPAHALDRPPSR